MKLVLTLFCTAFVLLGCTPAEPDQYVLKQHQLGSNTLVVVTDLPLAPLQRVLLKYEKETGVQVHLQPLSLARFDTAAAQIDVVIAESMSMVDQLVVAERFEPLQSDTLDAVLGPLVPESRLWFPVLNKAMLSFTRSSGVVEPIELTTDQPPKLECAPKSLLSGHDTRREVELQSEVLEDAPSTLVQTSSSSEALKLLNQGSCASALAEHRFAFKNLKQNTYQVSWPSELQFQPVVMGATRQAKWPLKGLKLLEWLLQPEQQSFLAQSYMLLPVNKTAPVNAWYELIEPPVELGLIYEQDSAQNAKQNTPAFEVHPLAESTTGL